MATLLSHRRNGNARAPTSASGPVRVAIYARISSADRSNSTFTSIDAQVAACRACVESRASMGWTAAEMFIDNGFTGANTNRPGLARLLGEIESDKFDVVLVHRIDRLSRSLRDLLGLVHALEEHGVAFASVNESFDSSTPIGKATLQLVGVFAELERATIAARTKDKVQAARRRGRWTGGVTPLGYQLVAGKLVPDPVEAHQVAEVFRIYLETGSLIETATEMNARGWLTKLTPTKTGVPRGGRAWDKGSVHRILTSPLYVGRIVSGADTVAAEHEAIVSVETWDAVQTRLEENAVTGSRGERRSSEALLAGLLTCEICGSVMSPSCARKGPRVYRYYRCSRQVKGGRAACPAKHVNAVKIEVEVVAQIAARAQDPAVVDAVLAATKERLSNQKKALAAERRALERALRQGDGGPTEGYRVRLDAIKAEAESLGDVTVDAETVAEALRDWDGLWGALTGRERRRVVEVIVEPGVFVREGGARATISTRGIRTQVVIETRQGD